jgi:hypothetical protein
MPSRPPFGRSCGRSPSRHGSIGDVKPLRVSLGVLDVEVAFALAGLVLEEDWRKLLRVGVPRPCTWPAWASPYGDRRSATTQRGGGISLWPGHGGPGERCPAAGSPATAGAHRHGQRGAPPLDGALAGRAVRAPPLPNPSGLNAHHQTRDLARGFRRLRRASLRLCRRPSHLVPPRSTDAAGGGTGAGAHRETGHYYVRRLLPSLFVRHEGRWQAVAMHAAGHANAEPRS